jgi:hypothetical protein
MKEVNRMLTAVARPPLLPGLLPPDGRLHHHPVTPAGGHCPTPGNNRISQYEDHFKKIMDYANTIEKAAIEVKENKREVMIGKDYKIRDLEKFNHGLNQSETQSRTIRNLAGTEK